MTAPWPPLPAGSGRDYLPNIVRRHRMGLSPVADVFSWASHLQESGGSLLVHCCVAVGLRSRMTINRNQWRILGGAWIGRYRFLSRQLKNNKTRPGEYSP